MQIAGGLVRTWSLFNCHSTLHGYLHTYLHLQLAVKIYKNCIQTLGLGMYSAPMDPARVDVETLDIRLLLACGVMAYTSQASSAEGFAGCYKVKAINIPGASMRQTKAKALLSQNKAASESCSGARYQELGDSELPA